LGGEKGAFGAGMEDVEDGLGLGEVDPAMQESSFRKLTRAGHPGTFPVERSQEGFHDQRISVAADFNQILPRVGTRPRPEGEDRFVQDFAIQA